MLGLIACDGSSAASQTADDAAGLRRDANTPRPPADAILPDAESTEARAAQRDARKPGPDRDARTDAAEQTDAESVDGRTADAQAPDLIDAQAPDVQTPDAAPPCEPEPATPYAEAEVQVLFGARCSACHLNGMRSGTLALDAPFLATTLNVFAEQHREMPLITAGDRDRSYLFHKLAGTQFLVGGAGLNMPFDRALCPDELERIGLFIDAL